MQQLLAVSMSGEEIDSDATVAPELELEEESQDGEEMVVEGAGTQSDSSFTSSPSILHPGGVVSSSLHPDYGGSEEKEETVPCSSSDEASNTISKEEEIMSQEYPLLIGAGEEEDDLRTLSQITRDQETLMSDINRTLDNYGDIFPTNFVCVTRDKISEMEIHLKAIGESHQAERKKLVGIHAQLSQGTASQAPASQDGLAEGSETLRSQLISLSARQKELLQCLRKQKGISNKLGMLVEREVNSRKMATSHNSQNTNIEVPKIIPNLLKHLHPPPPIDSKSLARPGLNSTTCNRANPSTRPPVCPPAPPPPPPPPTSTRQTTHTPHQSLSQPPSQADIQALLPNSSVSGAKPPPSAELTQPVPLDVLVKHQILQAGSQNLICMILGCEFTGSLLEDGSIQEVHTQESPAGGGRWGQNTRHQAPQQWVKACWARLGHQHKKPTKKQTYNMILYKGKVLSYYCIEYSSKQVSSYLSHRRKHGSADDARKKVKPTNTLSVGNALPDPLASNNGTPGPPASNNGTPEPPLSVEFDLSALLSSGKVLLIPSEAYYQSLQLPPEFWKEGGREKLFPRMVLRQIETDLDW